MICSDGSLSQVSRCGCNCTKRCLMPGSDRCRSDPGIKALVANRKVRVKVADDGAGCQNPAQYLKTIYAAIPAERISIALSFAPAVPIPVHARLAVRWDMIGDRPGGGIIQVRNANIAVSSEPV